MPASVGLDINPWITKGLLIRRSPLLAYGAAIFIVAVATASRVYVADQLGDRMPFFTFYPAVVFAAVLSGSWAGAFAASLSAFCTWYFFIPPFFSWGVKPAAATQLALFFPMALLIVLMVGILDRLLQQLVLQHRNIQLLLQASPNGYVLVDKNGMIKLVNETAEKLFGYKRDEVIGKDVASLIAVDQAVLHSDLQHSIQKEAKSKPDVNAKRKDGSHFPVDLNFYRLAQNGKSAVLATVTDISARKIAEKHQQLIVEELEHRTRNIFSVVTALIHNSAKDARTAAELRYVVTGRIMSLAEAYNLLSEGSWEGATVAQLLSRQLALHAGRLSIQGCDLILPPRVAQQFALIIHELMTNALKYGALSAPQGRVTVTGHIESQMNRDFFVFSWTESGGPRVQPPTRSGFGTVLMMETPSSFGGRAFLVHEATGIQYKLQLDLEHIAAMTKTDAANGLGKTSA